MTYRDEYTWLPAAALIAVGFIWGGLFVGAVIWLFAG